MGRPAARRTLGWSMSWKRRWGSEELPEFPAGGQGLAGGDPVPRADPDRTAAQVGQGGG
jgi:hypothetical protein